MDPEVHRMAKKAAKRRSTSVSGLITDLLRAEVSAPEPGIVDRLVGSATLREPAPGDDPLFEAIAKKHLRK